MKELKKRRTRYDETFKQNAVRLLINSHKPVTEIAFQLGIEQSVLNRWNKKYAPEIKSLLVCTSESLSNAEISELKKEIAAIRSTLNTIRGIILKTLGEKYTTI